MGNPTVFKKRFARDNLSYSVREVEDKDQKLLEILRKVPGSAIVYARTRKDTKEVAQWLYSQGVSTDYYHGGLTNEQRSNKQDRWIAGKARVMVATNAFGMGIDKPDVRVVVHLAPSDNLEAYYQEAGRGGRDGKKAYAVILYHKRDGETMKEMAHKTHPQVAYLKKIYQCLANYFKLAVGSGTGYSNEFVLHEFATTYALEYAEAYYAIKKLEEEGLVQLNESFYDPSRIHFVVDNKAMYEFQVANATVDPFIKGLLRAYGGELFTNFVNIVEEKLAKIFGIPVSEVMRLLQYMHDSKVLHYDKQKDKPQLTFLTPRHDAASIPLNTARINERKKSALNKIEAVLQYTNHETECRTILLLEYFGEQGGKPCGICDNCLKNKPKIRQERHEKYENQVFAQLRTQALTIEELVEKIPPDDKELFFDTVKDLIDAGVVYYDSHWQLCLSS